MEVNKILSADFLDILFDGRNKEYGAYELRKTYNKRITIALMDAPLLQQIYEPILSRVMRGRPGLPDAEGLAGFSLDAS